MSLEKGISFKLWPLFVSLWVMCWVPFNTALAQCPKVYDISIEGRSDSSICVPDLIKLTAEVDYIPSGGTLRWYSSNNPNFNPLASQGTLLEEIILPAVNFPLACPTVCPDLQLLYSGPCTTSGAPFKNEYVVISSGGGFYASDLRLELDAKANPNNEQVNNSIEIGANPCQIKIPDAVLINQLRTGNCNPSNLIPAGPGDYIPPGALVVLFLHADIGNNIEFSEYCAAGKPIYILQNACERTLPAFSYNSTCTGNDRFVYQSISIKGCPSCFDELNYDLCGYPMFQSTFVVDNNRPLSSNNNGGIQGLTDCQKPPITAFYQPDTTLQFEVFLDDINDSLCGTTLYYKAVLLPNEPGCSNVITTAFPLKVECPFFSIDSFTDTVCSGTPLVINLSGPPNATYSWIVDASLNINGLSSKIEKNSTISQIPVSTSMSPETVTYNIQNLSGECASDTEIVSIVVLPPIDANITGPLQFCSGESSTLSVNPNNANVLWSTGQIGNNINVTIPGEYSVVVSNSLCSFSDTVTIEEVDVLLPEISGDSILCDGSKVVLKGPDGFDSYTWSNGESTQEVSISSPGTYQLEVIQGSCKGSNSIVVKALDSIQVNEIITPPSCSGVNNGSITLIVNIDDTTILWSNGDTGKIIKNLSAGIYTYKIVLSSVCSQSKTLEIPPTLPLEMDILTTGVGCIEGNQGSIDILQVSNSTLPLSFSFNGGNFSGQDNWDNLSEGIYSISVKDSAGCTLDTIIAIKAGLPLTITLPDTLYLSSGETTSIIPSIQGADSLTTYTWSPVDRLSCQGCPSPLANPIVSQSYQLVATNEAGCRDSAAIFILVESGKWFYVPQAFSPNGDGINDRAGILSSNNDVTILTFKIFNRWGELVFEAKDFSPGNINASWNGQYKGKEAPIDTYTYYAEALFGNSISKKIKGQILLVR